MTSDDIGKLREDAARLLGLKLNRTGRGAPAYYIINEKWVYQKDWHPDTDANQAALLLAEVERRGSQLSFASRLIVNLRAESLHPRPLVWAIANATPLQKTQAAVQALENPDDR